MQIKLHAFVIGLMALFVPISAVNTPFNATVCLLVFQSYQRPTRYIHFQFDNLEGSPDARLDPVRIYYGIYYSSFGVDQPGVAGESVSGVMPHSDPNFASGASSLSIAYAGSKIKSFALDSYYYGCGTGLVQGEVEAAVNCSITVTGYKAGSTTPAQPIDLMNAPAFGTFSHAFQGLQDANFTFTPSAPGVIVIDNLIGSTQS